MAVRLSTRDTLGDVVVLRRAVRASGDPSEQERLSGVERHLRQAVGSSVPKLAAARALGVSLTALDRWIDRGLVPVVRAPGSSRLQPESGPLLELLEQVQLLREQGRRGHLITAALRRLGRRPLGPGRCILSAELAALPRPNVPAWQLQADAESTTPLERLEAVAELSEALTSLSGLRAPS
jgi:DNA-binding transcriptional MerR regulator